METEIDWTHVAVESIEGRLMEILRLLPRDQWQSSFIWYACKSDKNIPALIALLQNGANVNEDPFRGRYVMWSPLLEAFQYRQSHTFKVLLAAGACQTIINPEYRDETHCILKAYNFIITDIDVSCLKILISNGTRLSQMDLPKKCIEALVQFEQGVLRCRDVIVILLGLKKRRNAIGQLSILKKLDRFLIQQILAVEIWTTRAD